MDLTVAARVLDSHGMPLIRTDFSDDSAWQKVVAALVRSVDFDDPSNLDPGENGYEPMLNVISHPSFAGTTSADLVEAGAVVYDQAAYVILADERSMREALSGGETTIVLVDLSVSDPEDAELFGSFMGRSFRCVVPELALIEANLSIDNMNFGEYADCADPDGVFRGFNEGA